MKLWLKWKRDIPAFTQSLIGRETILNELKKLNLDKQPFLEDFLHYCCFFSHYYEIGMSGAGLTGLSSEFIFEEDGPHFYSIPNIDIWENAPVLSYSDGSMLLINKKGQYAWYIMPENRFEIVAKDTESFMKNYLQTLINKRYFTCYSSLEIARIKK